MSVQFGKWNFDGRPVDRDYLEKAKASIAPYGPDDAGSYSKNNVSILYHAFHTTKESRRETQPHVTASGAVLTWDGRLDNRADLIQQLRDVVTITSTDVAIVAAAYEYWGGDCFAMLIGDWALSLWDPYTQSLILAKDPIGTHHLYYSFDTDQVTWSTILDPLVLFAGKTFALCEEYIAGWFSFFPAAHLTPYVGVCSVPASSSVLIRPGKHTMRKYWDFDPAKRILYSADAEYEEHFRTAFAEAVGRRLRSDSPILAELSGGMDSSSIVCMADTIIARGTGRTPRLDTISYYDDSEPNWNELPYIMKVEEKRGRLGWRIEAGSEAPFRIKFEPNHIAVTPDSINSISESASEYRACVVAQGNRVVLSGIGGDEVTGGNPTPIPVLANFFSQGRIWSLSHHLKLAALELRKPWFHLLFETFLAFLPPTMLERSRRRQHSPWLTSSFVRCHRKALIGYEKRLNLLRPLPSFQIAQNSLEGLRRQAASFTLPQDPLFETRYPFMDRSLLEFLFAIPPEQLVRPGQRRSLMRRALVGIVPNEILQRKRKSFVSRAPLAAISKEGTFLHEMCRHMFTGSMGIVNVDKFSSVLQEARRGQQVPIVSLLRTITLEAWMRHISEYAFFDTCTAERGPNRSFAALRTNSLLQVNKNNLS